MPCASSVAYPAGHDHGHGQDRPMSSVPSVARRVTSAFLSAPTGPSAASRHPRCSCTADPFFAAPIDRRGHRSAHTDGLQAGFLPRQSTRSVTQRQAACTAPQTQPKPSEDSAICIDCPDAAVGTSSQTPSKPSQCMENAPKTVGTSSQTPFKPSHEQQIGKI